MPKRYDGMTDQEQADEVGVFLSVLDKQDIETQTLALEAIMDITRYILANSSIKTFETARDHARAIYWAIVQEKEYIARRVAK